MLLHRNSSKIQLQVRMNEGLKMKTRSSQFKMKLRERRNKGNGLIDKTYISKHKKKMKYYKNVFLLS